MSYQKDGCTFKFLAILLLSAGTLAIFGCGGVVRQDPTADPKGMALKGEPNTSDYQEQSLDFKLENGYSIYRYEGYFETVFVSSTGHFQVIPKRQRASAQ